MIDKVNYVQPYYRVENCKNNCCETNGYLSSPVETNKPSQEEALKKINSAVRAYALARLQKPYEQLSFQDCILRLQQEGKKEGQDYFIESSNTCNNLFVNIIDKNKGMEKRIFYNGGFVDRPSGYDVTKYLKDNKEHHIGFDDRGSKTFETISQNGEIIFEKDYQEMNVHEFSNATFPQSQFTKEGITSKTTADEYIKYLQDNNIQYQTSEVHNGEGALLIVKEFDKNATQTQSTTFELDVPPEEAVVMRELRNNNDEITRLELHSDKTLVNRTSLKK